MPTASTAKTVKKLLDLETNARFWAQTGYRIGLPLAPATNPTDKAMAKVWMDIYAKVKAEDARGKLVLTYNSPTVKAMLDKAKAANAVAASQLDAAAKAPNAAVAAAHVIAANKAMASASESAAVAAALQPPTVSPEVATAAAREATLVAETAPPPKLNLPAAHPANGPAAQPHPVTAQLETPPMEIDPPRTASEMLAVEQATRAPAKAAQVHQVAAGGRAATSTVTPAMMAQSREHAKALAAGIGAPFVGVAQMADGQWTASGLPSRDALDGWYGEIADHPEKIRYGAMFDKNEIMDPVNEIFGTSGKSIVVSVTVDRPPPVVKTNYGAIAAVGAVAVAGVAAVFAGRGKKKKSA